VAGDALEHATAGREVERAGALSLHYLHAQRWDRCWYYARLGADRARAKYANVEAAELYQRALTASGHLDIPADDLAAVWEALGDVAMLAGEFDRTRGAFRRARRLRAGDTVAEANLCAQEYRAAMHQGRTASARRWVRRGLRLLDEADGQLALSRRAELGYMLAHSYQQGGRPVAALAWASRAFDDAVLSGNRTAEVWASLVQDWALLALGRSDEAVRASRALELAEELGSAAGAADALLYMGNFAYMRGRWDDALDLWTRAGDAYGRAGNTVDAALGASNSAEILLCQGRYDEAEARLREVVDVWRSMGYSGGLGDALTSLGRIALHRGDVGEAANLFKESRDLFASSADARELSALGGLAECNLHEGEIDDALVLLDDALRRQALSGDTTFAAMLHRVRAYALAALDRLDDAWAAVDESLAVARATGAAYEVALTLEALSVVAELGGLPPDASADAERAALLEQLGIQTTPPPPLRIAA
jgi:tetratricopeptide (TPR) repeat protein